MAPTKSTSTSNRLASKDAATVIASLIPTARKGITRGKSVQDQNVEVVQTRAKRKADHNSPIKNDKIKRSALGNLTNNANKLTNKTQHPDDDAKQKLNIAKKAENVVSDENIVAPKITTRATAKNAKAKASTVAKTAAKNESVKTVGPKPLKPLLPPPAPVATNNVHALLLPKAVAQKSRRISNEFNQTEDSLYMSALEDISSCESMRLSGNFEAAKRRSMLLQQQKGAEPIKTEAENKAEKTEDEDDGRFKDILSPLALALPSDVEDFDKMNLNDPFQVSNYAMDIFNYLKMREQQFVIDDFMPRQVHLTKYMRSLLVDWMVEVQETFELNHETLYLAVKIVDLFLVKVLINKEKLQLLGAASLFIACKFDERTPPLIEDFLYICDGAYKHDELVKMEMRVLRTIDYDLGIPLSYRFLRRYARCAKILMPTLTLARYVLELSLMDYDTIGLSDSRLACAALFIALRMQGEPKAWSPTLEYYTGYKLADFVDIIPLLNAGLHRKQKGAIKNIRNKYSHKIFHEVALIELMSTDQLFENELNSSLSPKSNDAKPLG